MAVTMSLHDSLKINLSGMSNLFLCHNSDGVE